MEHIDTPIPPLHFLSSYCEPGTVPITLPELVPLILQQACWRRGNGQRGQVTSSKSDSKTCML